MRRRELLQAALAASLPCAPQRVKELNLVYRRRHGAWERCRMAELTVGEEVRVTTPQGEVLAEGRVDQAPRRDPDGEVRCIIDHRGA